MEAHYAKQLQCENCKTSQQLSIPEQTHSKCVKVLFVTVQTFLSQIFKILNANVQVTANVKLLSTELLHPRAQARDFNECNVKPPPKRVNPAPVVSQNSLQPIQQSQRSRKLGFHGKRETSRQC